MCATKVMVGIPGEDDYAIRIGEGVLDDLGRDVRALPCAAKATRVLLLTDSNVGPLYADRAKASLAAAGFQATDVTIPAGEENKNIQVIAEIWEAMADLALGRDCLVVALGGGVVGDMAGFVAATYMRGVPVIQVPTTLLSMVDSSVGGKTGFNLSAGKNLVGAFKQPAFVCASTDVLATLNEREWSCGLAEIAKSAVIDSDDFFFWLVDNAPALMERSTAAVTEAITRSVVFKANVVAQDKTESKGVRECLNYGHTLAHAVELLSGYGTYSHGHAVAEGMRFAARLGQHLVGTPAELVQEQDALLDALGLPAIEWRTDEAAMLDAMKKDKKARAGNVRFTLPSDVGSWELATVDDERIAAQLREWKAGETA
ncbi:MAG: 3-dehydroquinate synthase [Coriobacteriia bacterium]|nr:3-dehydroquinate synthase [Coriobacteriia bacterium]